MIGLLSRIDTEEDNERTINMLQMGQSKSEKDLMMNNWSNNDTDEINLDHLLGE